MEKMFNTSISVITVNVLTTPIKRNGYQIIFLKKEAPAICYLRNSLNIDTDRLKE